MGGIKFVDFLMMHKFLGIKQFVSIERDADVIERCKFNKPFGNISIYNGDVSDYVDEFDSGKPHIFWLDYDWALSQNIFEDLIDLGSKLVTGSFLVVTVSGEASGPLRRLNDRERLRYFRDTLNDFSLDLSETHFSDASIRFAVSTMLLRILVYSFRARHPIQFFPYIKVLYKDSMWMVTVGGYLGETARGLSLAQELGEHLPFLTAWEGESFFQIPQFNITDSERRIFDLLVTDRPCDRSTARIVRKWGFDANFVRQYRNMIRYIPRYFETAW